VIGKSKKHRSTFKSNIPQSLIEEFKAPFVLSWVSAASGCLIIKCNT
jgi:hypothetical protein